MTFQVESPEIVALRNGCQYELYEDEPESGTWWAIQVMPCKFPGQWHPTTEAGVPVCCAAIVACERRPDNGLWQWCHLSIMAKQVFGGLLLDNQMAAGVWYYVLEIPPNPKKVD